MAAQTRPPVDEVTGTETTGHEWDGIAELNNPLPRWWLWTFYGTVAFSIVYCVLYPAVPLVREATQGLLGWSSRGEVARDLAERDAARQAVRAALASKPLEEIAADPALRQAAVEAGRAAFTINCVQCHGSGAAGGPGYPNLNDDAWLWGGTLQDIAVTLRHGIRHAPDPDTRVSQMPAFGDGVLDRNQIAGVAWHVRALAGLPTEGADEAVLAAGAELYAANCAACHGEAGEGDQTLGAPRLNDALWQYGGSHAEIARQIGQPRHGVMPGWGARLGEETIKELTLYVHSLGGGQ